MMLFFTALFASSAFLSIQAGLTIISAPESKSDGEIVISYEGTKCVVKGGELFINDTSMGNLTVEQLAELEEYKKKVNEWSDSLQDGILKSVSRMISSATGFLGSILPWNWLSSPETPQPSSDSEPAASVLDAVRTKRAAEFNVSVAEKHQAPENVPAGEEQPSAPVEQPRVPFEEDPQHMSPDNEEPQGQFSELAVDEHQPGPVPSPVDDYQPGPALSNSAEASPIAELISPSHSIFGEHSPDVSSASAFPGEPQASQIPLDSSGEHEPQNPVEVYYPKASHAPIHQEQPEDQPISFKGNPQASPASQEDRPQPPPPSMNDDQSHVPEHYEGVSPPDAPEQPIAEVGDDSAEKVEQIIEEGNVPAEVISEENPPESTTAAAKKNAYPAPPSFCRQKIE